MRPTMTTATKGRARTGTIEKLGRNWLGASSPSAATAMSCARSATTPPPQLHAPQGPFGKSTVQPYHALPARDYNKPYGRGAELTAVGWLSATCLPDAHESAIFYDGSSLGTQSSVQDRLWTKSSGNLTELYHQPFEGATKWRGSLKLPYGWHQGLPEVKRRKID